VRARPPDDGSNPYHAELLRDDFRQNRTQLYAFATMVRDIFVKHGRFVDAPPENGAHPARSPRRSASPHLGEPEEAPPRLPAEADIRPVPLSLKIRMADRLWALGSPSRREAYVNRARLRLAAGRERRSDSATVLAAKGILLRSGLTRAQGLD
jgi:hypothetical protein